MGSSLSTRTPASHNMLCDDDESIDQRKENDFMAFIKEMTLVPAYMLNGVKSCIDVGKWADKFHRTSSAEARRAIAQAAMQEAESAYSIDEPQSPVAMKVSAMKISAMKVSAMKVTAMKVSAMKVTAMKKAAPNKNPKVAAKGKTEPRSLNSTELSSCEPLMMPLMLPVEIKRSQSPATPSRRASNSPTNSSIKKKRKIDTPMTPVNPAVNDSSTSDSAGKPINGYATGQILRKTATPKSKAKKEEKVSPQASKEKKKVATPTPKRRVQKKAPPTSQGNKNNQKESKKKTLTSQKTNKKKPMSGKKKQDDGDQEKGNKVKTASVSKKKAPVPKKKVMKSVMKKK